MVNLKEVVFRQKQLLKELFWLWYGQHPPLEVNHNIILMVIVMCCTLMITVVLPWQAGGMNSFTKVIGSKPEIILMVAMLPHYNNSYSDYVITIVLFCCGKWDQWDD